MDRTLRQPVASRDIVMTQDEIRQLERDAADLYQAGEYQKAKDLWRQVLEADPGNERAEEGMRMAGLLSDNWDFFAEEGGEDEAGVRSGLDQVAKLADEGRFQDALAALDDLARDFPDRQEIAQTRTDVERAYESAPFIAEQLDLARRARSGGRAEQAAAACRKVLALDPMHRTARALLEELDLGAPAPVAAPPAAPDEGDLDLPMLDLVEAPERETATPAEPPADDARDASPDLAPPDRPPESPGARVSILVEEGHRALDEGRYAEAIDRFSRALALDETHEGASTLLEQARRAQTQWQDLAEAKMIEGADLLEAGRLDEAEAMTRQVLAQVPDHAGAVQQLERIEEARRAPSDVPASPSTPLSPEPGSDDLAGLGDLADELQLDAEPGAVELQAPPEEAPPSRSQSRASRHASAPPGEELVGRPPARVRRGLRPAWIAVPMMVVVAAGAWFFRGDLLPLVGLGGSAAAPPSLETQGGAALAEPASAAPAPEPPESTATTAPAGPSAADVPRLLDEVRAHLREGSGEEALHLLATIESLAPDRADARDLAIASRWLATAREAFEAGDYAASLRSLYRLAQLPSAERPRQVDLWLHSARWNYLLEALREGEPAVVLDRANRELQLRGEERARLQPLLDAADHWKFEGQAALQGPEYRATVARFATRPLDD